MKVIFGKSALRDLEERFDYSNQNFGPATTQVAFERLHTHVESVIAQYPRTGRLNRRGRFWEAWVPRTPFIVAYRIDEANRILTVLAIFHHAQDRSKFRPPRED